MSPSGSTPTSSATGFPAADASELAALRTRLGEFHGGGLADAEQVDLIEELERLKAAAAAAQARVTVAFAESQTREALAGLPEAATAGERRRVEAQVSRSVAGQVALARRDSPARGQRHLGLARALVGELPHTMAALSRGEVSEWRATIVARETACLSVEDRVSADAEIAPRLAELGDRRLGDTARGIAQRLDPASAVRRARKAIGERRVGLRPAPDTMCYLTGLLPVTQGVAVFAALKAEANALHGHGDPRTPAQLMADLLVGKVTGIGVCTLPDTASDIGAVTDTGAATHAGDGSTTDTEAGSSTEESANASTETSASTSPNESADAGSNASAGTGIDAEPEPGSEADGEPGAAGPVREPVAETLRGSIARRAGTWDQPPASTTDTTAAAPVNSSEDTLGVVPGVEVQIVMSDRSLFAGEDEPAHLTGFGPIPASLARRLVRGADRVWLRRLFVRPETGDLIAADSRRRLFAGRLRDLVVWRDQVCRNPWCDAPIRHVDHVRAHREGGATSRDNGQGLCAACNYLKEAPGWRADLIHLPDAQTDLPHTVETVTPTGHRYRSSAPPQPGTTGPPGTPQDTPGRVETVFERLLRDTA